MKPFIKYPGGKTKELPLINRYKPDVIQRYFEPFLGGGSVFLNLQNSVSFVNDYSKDLMSVYFYVKEGNEIFFNSLEKINMLWKAVEENNFLKTVEKSELINFKDFNKYYEESLKRKQKTISKLSISSKLNLELMEITARKTAVYMCIRDIYNEKKNNELHVASYYFLREYCYSSMFRFASNGNFNVPFGGNSYSGKYMDEKIGIMKSNQINNLFATTKFYNLDFEDFLNQFDFNDKDFIFLDPPYDSDFSTYDKNSFDKNEQTRLRNVLLNVKAKWMLIIKKTDFIYDLYKDFHIYEYNNKYMVSFKNRNQKGVVHLLITNYELNEE